MLLVEIADGATNKRSQAIDKAAMSIATFLRKHPTQIPAAEKIFGVKLPQPRKGLNTNDDGSVVFESLTETVVLGDLYGVPREFFIEGRPNINAVILDFYQLDEGVLSGAKGAFKMYKQLADKVNKAGSLLQDTTPVQGADDKIADLVGKYKTKLGNDHPAVKAATNLGEIAKQHPKKTAFIIGALTGLISAFGTPAAAMAIGVALRTAVGMAKGERFTTAFAKAVKVAGVGAAAGAVVGGLMDVVKSSGISLSSVIGDTAVSQLDNGFSHFTVNVGDAESAGRSFKGTLIVPQNDATYLKDMAAMIKSGEANDYQYKKFLDTLEIAFHKQETYAQLSGASERIANAAANSNFLDGIKKAIASAAAGGAASASKDNNGGKYTKSTRTKVDPEDKGKAADTGMDANAEKAAPEKTGKASYRTAIAKLENFASKLQPDELRRAGQAIANILG